MAATSGASAYSPDRTCQCLICQPLVDGGYTVDLGDHAQGTYGIRRQRPRAFCVIGPHRFDESSLQSPLEVGDRRVVLPLDTSSQVLKGSQMEIVDAKQCEHAVASIDCLRTDQGLQRLRAVHECGPQAGIKGGRCVQLSAHRLGNGGPCHVLSRGQDTRVHVHPRRAAVAPDAGIMDPAVARMGITPPRDTVRREPASRLRTARRLWLLDRFVYLGRTTCSIDGLLVVRMPTASRGTT